MLTHRKDGKRFPITQAEDCHDPLHAMDAELEALEWLKINGPAFTCDVMAAMALHRKREKYNRDRIRLMGNSDQIYYDNRRFDPVIYRPLDQLDKKKGSTELHPPSAKQFMVHDITGQGKALLRRAGRYHRITHGGWWDHKFANSRVGWGLMLGAREDKLPFIPEDHIVKDNIAVRVPYTTPEGIDIDDQNLHPDALSGFNRYLTREMDLGTETGRVGEKKQLEDDETLFRTKKSYLRMFLQYHQLIGMGLYKQLYRIPADKPLLNAFITTSYPKYLLAMDICSELTGGKGFNWQLFKYIPRERLLSPFHQKVLTDIVWREPYERVGNRPFYLDNPERQ